MKAMPLGPSLPALPVTPVLTLAAVAPLLGEVSSGATRLSYLFAYIPEVLMWGCGAVLIREAVCRWRAGWPSMLALALALSIWEEFLVQQTSFAPLPGLPANASYGRAGGVNWLYFLFMLAFESMTIVMVPIQAVEGLFLLRRGAPWLRRRGLWICGSLFLLGSLLAWFVWVKVAREQVFHMPPYRPSAPLLAAGVVAISAALALGRTLARPRQEPVVDVRPAPAPSRIFAATLLLSVPWYALLILNYVPVSWLPPLWSLLAIALGLAGLSLALAVRWTGAAGWSSRHSFSVALGIAVACSGGGYLGVANWSLPDIVFKAVVDVVALLCLLWLTSRSTPTRSI